jgi:hypothetical protein
VYPKGEVVRSILEEPPAGVPRLDLIASTPFFAPEGEWICEPGYHERLGALLSPAPELRLASVPVHPTPEDVTRARELIESQLLGDFPFTLAADRAHLIALMLEPFTALLVNGNRPLHVLEAPESGSGKSLLGDVVSLIACGRRMAWRAFPTAEDECRKTIFSALLAGKAFVAFDNVKGRLGGPALESALTSGFVESRILGAHREGTVRNTASWIVSVNNGELSRDLTRRAVRTRLDTGLENPEHRTSFRHADLHGWALEHRGELVNALATLVTNWIAKGRPDFSGHPLASFERWSGVMGGILEAAGIPGFLAPEASMTPSDPEKQEAIAFVAAWFTRFGREPVTARDLLTEVCEVPVRNERQNFEIGHLASVLGGGSAEGRTGKLGKWLSRNFDRVFGGLTLRKASPDRHAKVCRFALELKEAERPAADAEVPV